MVLHLWRFGGGLLLGASLLAASSVAVDRAATPAQRRPGASESRHSAAATRSRGYRASTPSASQRHFATPDARGRDWQRAGAWSSIEEQIRKPAVHPPRRLPVTSESLRLRSPTAEETILEPGPSLLEDENALHDVNSADDFDPANDAGAVDAEIDSDSIDDTGAAGEAGSSDAADSPGDPDSTLNPDLLALRTKIRGVLANYRTRQLNTRDHNPWEVMHSIVAFNVDTEIHRDGPNGPSMNAVGWFFWGGRCRGQQMLTLQRGRPHAEEGVGVQGHPAQLLAILAQSRVSAQTPLRIDGKAFTLQDLIDEEMLDCRAESELTFKLISFAHYLPSDAVWRSRDGQSWSIPRLINAEIKSPIRGAACGGTHRLFGISYAYQMRELEGRPIDGEFLRAKQYTESYQQYAWSLQNPDGSFSTEWFARRGDRPDIDRKMQTTGHILEWLVASLPDEQLRRPRTLKSVDFIATSLAGEPSRNWSIGPLGHALHALMIYDERVFGGGNHPPETNSLARRLSTSSVEPVVASGEPTTDAAIETPSDETAVLATPQGPVFPGLD